MKILSRLIKEFWFPALLAIAWTAFNTLESGPTWDLKKLLNIFGPTFFLVSWATGQYFRIVKQTHVETNLTNIETRVEKLVSNLEGLTKDFIGHSTGADSIAYFIPMLRSLENVFELALHNPSTYPVFDIYAELIDLDQPIDITAGKYWSRHRFTVGSIYPNKTLMGAYRFDVSSRERLNVNVFIFTRGTQGISQQFRMVKGNSGAMSVAIKTTAGNTVIQEEVPEGFPIPEPGKKGIFE